MFAADELVS